MWFGRKGHLIHLNVSISLGKNHQVALSVPALTPSLPFHLCPVLPTTPALCTQIYADTNINTHPCGTVAEHCNFSTAAVFACRKSDTPLALLSLPLLSWLLPSIHTLCVHLSICTVCTSRAAVLKWTQRVQVHQLSFNIPSLPAALNAGATRVVHVVKCVHHVCVENMCACWYWTLHGPLCACVL